MKTNHTPGPWTMEIIDGVQPDGYRYTYYPHANIRVKNRPVAQVRLTSVGYSGSEKDRETDEANVRLIAAAPELLEACEYVARWHREHDSGEGELFGLDFVTTCIAAIRKAKGE